MATMQFNNTICERDMDMLFIQSVLTDKGFCRLVIDKTDLAGKDFSVLNAELSKTDEELGESDITIIVDIEGVKYGLLIEDKIDAIAARQPNTVPVQWPNIVAANATPYVGPNYAGYGGWGNGFGGGIVF